MSRVFVSDTTGAAIYVFSDDHCPPHVHVRHRGEGWVMRVTFSYVGSEVDLISISPLRSIPLQRAVNGLLHEIQTRLVDCRRMWWTMRQTTCLENQWAVARVDGRLEPGTNDTPKARQIANATYDPTTEWLHIIFRDGTTTEAPVHP